MLTSRTQAARAKLSAILVPKSAVRVHISVQLLAQKIPSRWNRTVSGNVLKGRRVD